jgi:hypothetical protein
LSPPQSPGSPRIAPESFASRLRVTLAREHLDHPDDAQLYPPLAMFDLFARSAARLDAWHEAGRQGPRPPGRLRSYPTPYLSPWTRQWAGALYRVVYDPDARPARLRREHRF